MWEFSIDRGALLAPREQWMSPHRSTAKSRRNLRHCRREVLLPAHRWNPCTQLQPYNDGLARKHARTMDRRSLPKPTSSRFLVLGRNRCRASPTQELPRTVTIFSSCPLRRVAVQRTVHQRSRHFMPKRTFHALKGRRGVHPQQPGLRPTWVSPTMRRRAFEIEAIALFQMVVLSVAEPDLKLAPQNVQKFLAFVRVGFSASTVRFQDRKSVV